MKKIENSGSASGLRQFRLNKPIAAAETGKFIYKLIFLFVLMASCNSATAATCSAALFANTPAPAAPYCPLTIKALRNAVYLLYDVNPPEGFNLRRDVYIRLAVFVRALSRRSATAADFANVRLVLPPWRRLYHWRSSHLQQDSLPWSAFFDVESLRRYAPVLDFPEFLAEVAQLGLAPAPNVPVHKVLQLLPFEEMFENGVFRDKFQFVSDREDCRREQHLRGALLQQELLLDSAFECVRFQGSASMLERVLRKALRGDEAAASNGEARIVALLNAEIVLHDHWGDREFWRARRSMRFAAPLVALADEFRLTQLDEDIAQSAVQRPPMWERETHYRRALGGDYLCAHLRRGDFLQGRERTTPTLKSAALQVKQALQAHNLSAVFLATDAGAFEVKNFRAYLQRTRVFRFAAESLQQKARIKDGGIAIVDQLVCAHARHFIGTYESTFTYRIYEEREILGFTRDSTFNTFCKSESMANCSKNSIWPVVY